MASPVSPRPVLMPHEIVQHRRFNRRRRRGEEMPVKHGYEQRERAEVNGKSDQSDDVERQPPADGAPP